MQKIEDYNPHLGVGILLQGAAGTGKTTLACHFPGAYVLDCDQNLNGAIRILKEKGMTLPVGFDTINVDENGKEVPMPQRYTRMGKCLKSAALEPSVKTIICDSATVISDYMIAEVLRQNGRTQMQLQDWGQYLFLWKNFITQLRSCGKMFILICHEKPEKDEMMGTLRYFINLPGQIAHQIPALMSDVWRCEVEEKAGTHKWMVRTLPNYRVDLKNSLGLPASFEMKWDMVADALKKQGVTV